jgi:hypothetical protein
MTVSLNMQQAKEAMEVPRILYRQAQAFFYSNQNTQKGVRVFVLPALND